MWKSLWCWSLEERMLWSTCAAATERLLSRLQLSSESRTAAYCWWQWFEGCVWLQRLWGCECTPPSDDLAWKEKSTRLPVSIWSFSLPRSSSSCSSFPLWPEPPKPKLLHAPPLFPPFAVLFHFPSRQSVRSSQLFEWCSSPPPPSLHPCSSPLISALFSLFNRSPTPPSYPSPHLRLTPRTPSELLVLLAGRPLSALLLFLSQFTAASSPFFLPHCLLLPALFLCLPPNPSLTTLPTVHGSVPGAARPVASSLNQKRLEDLARGSEKLSEAPLKSEQREKNDILNRLQNTRLKQLLIGGGACGGSITNSLLGV